MRMFRFPSDAFCAILELPEGGTDMSQITKRALAASLKKLLAQKPLSRITIADITEDCGINRMTFYYHFQDIYDLIDWICQEEGGRALQGRKDYGTWQEGFTALCHAVVENRAFIEGVYHSVQREQIENYLGRVVCDLLMGVVQELSGPYAVSREDQAYITNFYKHAFVGVMLDWVKGGMREQPEQVVGRVSKMTRGQLLGAIRNMADGPALSKAPQ